MKGEGTSLVVMIVVALVVIAAVLYIIAGPSTLMTNTPVPGP